MAATAEAVPDERRRRWWEAFSHGFAVDQGEYEEPEVDVDAGSDFERVAGNAHTRVDEQSIPAAAAARHCEGNQSAVLASFNFGRACYCPVPTGHLLPLGFLPPSRASCSDLTNGTSNSALDSLPHGSILSGVGALPVPQ
jgi:hypothetical protein